MQKALAFIGRNAVRGIGVQDVARHLKVSYSLLNLRFQELQGTSVYEALLRTRLGAVIALLKTSDEKIDTIAERCGWKAPASLKKLFKQRYGVSMRAYRKAHAGGRVLGAASTHGKLRSSR